MHDFISTIEQWLRIRTQKQILLGIFVIYGSLAVARLAAGGWNPTHFSVVGATFVDQATAPDFVKISDESGYDGQFFLRTALNPFTNQATEFGISYDKPAYRHSRILYPFLAFAGTQITGQDTVGYWLLVINFLAVLALAYFSMQLCTFYNAPPILAIFPVLLSGVALAFGRGLAEPLALSLLAASLHSFAIGRYGRYAFFISLAILTRESSLLVAFALGVTSLIGKNRLPLTKILYCCIPALVLGAWYLLHYLNWGQFALSDTPPNRGLPFAGLYHEIFVHNHRETWAKDIIMMIYLSWQFVFGWKVFQALKSIPAGSHLVSALKLAFYLWIALAVCFGPDVWRREWGFARIFLEWNLIGFIILLHARYRIRFPYWAWTSFIFLISYLRLIVKV